MRGVSPVWAEDSNIEYRCGRPHVASFATRRNGLMSPCCLLHVVAHFESLTSIIAFESFDWKVVFENLDPAWRRTACVCVCAQRIEVPVLARNIEDVSPYTGPSPRRSPDERVEVVPQCTREGELPNHLAGASRLPTLRPRPRTRCRLRCNGSIRCRRRRRQLRGRDLHSMGHCRSR